MTPAIKFVIKINHDSKTLQITLNDFTENFDFPSYVEFDELLAISHKIRDIIDWALKISRRMPSPTEMELLKNARSKDNDPQEN